MARMAMPMFEVTEYQGSVRPDLIVAAKSNSNLSDMTSYSDSPWLAKDLRATADYLMAEGCTTASFFLLDELKRMG